MNEKSELKKKINVYILIIISIFLLLFLIGSFLILKSNIEIETKKRLEDGVRIFMEDIMQKKDFCITTVSAIAIDKDIKSNIKSNNSDDLKKSLDKIYNFRILEILEFENCAGKVIYRAHNPELYGDDKSGQLIIKNAINGKASVSFDNGNTGLAIRAAAPVVIDGKVEGIIMSGIHFSKKFVDRIKQLSGFENGIYINNSKIISTYSGLDSITLDEINKLKKNNIVFKKINFKNKADSIFILKPIFVDNLYWGFISMACYSYEETIISLFFKAFIIFVSIGIIIFFIANKTLSRNIYNSLDQIIYYVDNIDFEKNNNRICLKTNDEFELIADSINNMRDKIQEYYKKNKELNDEMIRNAQISTAGQIAAGVAHEIRNPLNSIKIMLQIIKERYITNQGTKEINLIQNEIDRINGLLKELIEFSKPSPVLFSYNNINEILDIILAIANYNIENQTIILKKDYDLDISPVKTDLEKIKLALINIILNAIQSMPEDGQLLIKR